VKKYPKWAPPCAPYSLQVDPADIFRSIAQLKYHEKDLINPASRKITSAEDTKSHGILTNIQEIFSPQGQQGV